MYTYICVKLTRNERHFAQHNPTQCEIQMHLNVLADAMMQFDGDVACIFHHRIGHVRKVHRFANEMLSTNAEKCFRMDKYLQTRMRQFS